MDRLLSVTLYLSKNNLAFRGSSDKFYTQSNGNYLSLVELLGKYDDVTTELLLKTLSREKTVHYCSHSIQNELINMMANKVLEIIIDRLRAEKYYSVILDCTPDVSHQEQLSFTLRFVNIKKKLKLKNISLDLKR